MGKKFKSFVSNILVLQFSSNKTCSPTYLNNNNNDNNVNSRLMVIGEKPRGLLRCYFNTFYYINNKVIMYYTAMHHSAQNLSITPYGTEGEKKDINCSRGMLLLYLYLYVHMNIAVSCE